MPRPVGRDRPPPLIVVLEVDDMTALAPVGVDGVGVGFDGS